jgi:hypothetical protein
MVSKFFQSPSKRLPLSNGDKIFLVTTTKAFQKHTMHPLFVATKKFWLPQGRVIKNISVIAVFTTKNYLVATKGTNQISSIAHPCGD